MSNGEGIRFTEVDWESIDQSRWDRLRPSAAGATALALLALVGAALAYDWFVVPAGAPTTGFWDVSRADWLTLATGALAVGYGIVPAVQRPDRIRSVWAAYPRQALPVVALASVVGLTLVGLLGPAVVGPPTFSLAMARQPPAFTSVATKFTNTCVGPVVESRCHGTLRAPLGTTRGGEDVLVWIVYGARTALQFGLVAVALTMPIAALVGTTAAYVGGRTEAVLMRVAELQETVPTFLVYFLLFVFVGPSLFVLILVYALFNWGGTAQLAYSAARSESEKAYVVATESAGAGTLYTVRRHLVPNVSGTVLADATLTVPTLILLEVLFSFVGLGGDQTFSWGQLVQRGLRFSPTQVQGGFATSLRGLGVGSLGGLWWIHFVPIAAVVVTVFLFSVFGDALQEAIESA